MMESPPSTSSAENATTKKEVSSSSVAAASATNNSTTTTTAAANAPPPPTSSSQPPSSKKCSQQEQRTFFLRVLFVSTMIVTGVVFAALTYTILSSSEENAALQTYESIAQSALDQAQKITLLRKGESKKCAQKFVYRFCAMPLPQHEYGYGAVPPTFKYSLPGPTSLMPSMWRVLWAS